MVCGTREIEIIVLIKRLFQQNKFARMINRINKAGYKRILNFIQQIPPVVGMKGNIILRKFPL